MAGTRAVTQFTDGVFHIRVFVFLMRTRIIVPGMTAGTIRFVTTIAPGHSLTLTAMAAYTGKTDTVVAWVIGRNMGKTEGAPCVYRVAMIAIPAGAKVTCRFTFGGGAVVAHAATAGHRVVIKIHRQPAIGSMANVTVSDELDMIRCYTGCVAAIVAGGAGAGHRTVVHTRGQPG